MGFTVTKQSTTAVLLLLGGAAVWQRWGPPTELRFGGVFLVGDETKPAEAEEQEEDFALFTHKNGELHCMERELRHPCVKELREWVKENTTDTRTTALSCVGEVLETTNDYWELKNMTHLLLDLDTNAHVFDKDSRDNEFVMAGIEYAKKLMQHEECLREFDTKGELECRCVPLYAKLATLKLKNAKKVDEAKQFFEEMKALSWDGQVRKFGPGEAIKWDGWQHTPQIWVDGLRSMPVWPRETWSDLPITAVLEENFKTIQEETERALKQEAESGFEDAYRFLYEKGEWNRVLLYHGRKFTKECELVFPKTCAVLKKNLPSKPGLPWLSDQNEQVMVIKMKKGTDVELHSGPANNILNIHLGISGLAGAELVVASESYSWEQGKVLAWDGSFDHSVNCLRCEADERVIMMVRYMHPDMSPEKYKNNKRTHYEDIPVEWQ